MAPESDIGGELVDGEELLLRPGTYFNPQTEVVVIVDDSASIDQGVLSAAGYEGDDWIRVSEAAPVDEQALEEALQEFQTRYATDSPGPGELEPDDDGVESGEPPPAAELPTDNGTEGEAVAEIAEPADQDWPEAERGDG